MDEYNKINVTLLHSYEKEFSTEYNNFNVKTYNSLNANYLSYCSDHLVRIMYKTLHTHLLKIQRSYSNIDSWWKDYNDNATSLENYLCGYESVGSISEPSIRNYALKLPILEDYDFKFPGALFSIVTTPDTSEAIFNNPIGEKKLYNLFVKQIKKSDDNLKSVCINANSDMLIKYIKSSIDDGTLSYKLFSASLNNEKFVKNLFTKYDKATLKSFFHFATNDDIYKIFNYVDNSNIDYATSLIIDIKGKISIKDLILEDAREQSHVFKINISNLKNSVLGSDENSFAEIINFYFHTTNPIENILTFRSIEDAKYFFENNLVDDEIKLIFLEKCNFEIFNFLFENNLVDDGIMQNRFFRLENFSSDKLRYFCENNCFPGFENVININYGENLHSKNVETIDLIELLDDDEKYNEFIKNYNEQDLYKENITKGDIARALKIFAGNNNDFPMFYNRGYETKNKWENRIIEISYKLFSTQEQASVYNDIVISVTNDLENYYKVYGIPETIFSQLFEKVILLENSVFNNIVELGQNVNGVYDGQHCIIKVDEILFSDNFDYNDSYKLYYDALKNTVIHELIHGITSDPEVKTILGVTDDYQKNKRGFDGGFNETTTQYIALLIRSSKSNNILNDPNALSSCMYDDSVLLLQKIMNLNIEGLNNETLVKAHLSSDLSPISNAINKLAGDGYFENILLPVLNESFSNWRGFYDEGLKKLDAIIVDLAILVEKGK